MVFMLNRSMLAVGLAGATLMALLLLHQRTDFGLPGEHAAASGRIQTIFAEDFESGALSAWSDASIPSHLRIVSDRSLAQSGSRYLAVSYPAGGDAGWLTRMLKSGYTRLYASYYVRIPNDWSGGTKLIAFYGSQMDNRWSAFGKAGICPNGGDFFAAMLVAEANLSTRFYTYYPAMAREPDGVTCWGRFGDRSVLYVPPLTLSRNIWHHVEFLVALNTPGEANARQTFWIDGVLRGRWSGLSFRDSSSLQLNSVQLTFSVSGGVPQSQELYIDNLVISTNRPSPDVDDLDHDTVDVGNPHPRVAQDPE
jgi:hypothetical protein